MIFDYRVIKRKDGSFIVGEVYYNEEDNSIVFWDPDPVGIEAESLEHLKEELDYVKQAFNKPILEEDKNGMLVEMVQQ